jgi:hypothetical protein
MKNNNSAFPVRSRWDSGYEASDLRDSGMTLPQYAAIHLKVPMSGDPEIDKMIRESRRLDFAGLATTGIVPVGRNPKEAIEYAREIADALLAEWEKEAEE